jgi:hypothetical protein|tara:strand:+ start:224 stop:412 length:189 start_codon:yes stop_codon:yes gene_type:complete
VVVEQEKVHLVPQAQTAQIQFLVQSHLPEVVEVDHLVQLGPMVALVEAVEKIVVQVVVIHLL